MPSGNLGKSFDHKKGIVMEISSKTFSLHGQENSDTPDTRFYYSEKLSVVSALGSDSFSGLKGDKGLP